MMHHELAKQLNPMNVKVPHDAFGQNTLPLNFPVTVTPFESFTITRFNELSAV